MKAIDHYIGVPVCLALDLFCKLLSFLPTRTVTSPRKILVMKFFGMGSILLASPMLRGLKERFPEARIGFLTFASNRDMVERLNLVDHVYTLRTDRFIHFFRTLLQALWHIRREGYDVTIDMEFFAKFSTIVTYLSGSPMRIGYFLRQMWRGDLLTQQIYYNHYKHITEVFGALAAPLGVTVSDFTPRKPEWTPEEDGAAAAMLEREGVLPGDLLVGFNVNVSDLSLERRWSKREFQRLAESLLTELDCKLVFIGSRSEAAYVAEVLDGIGRGNDRIVNLAGKTGLGELLGVMARMSLFITNDSGPLHIAAALGKPTLSFFGPETPILYGPRGRDPLVFYEGIYCSPCLNVFNVKTAPCSGQNVCMQAINAEEVLAIMRNRYHQLWENHRRDP